MCRIVCGIQVIPHVEPVSRTHHARGGLADNRHHRVQKVISEPTKQRRQFRVGHPPHLGFRHPIRPIFFGIGASQPRRTIRIERNAIQRDEVCFGAFGLFPK